VRSVPEGRPIVFVPDKNLGLWVRGQTGRELILWEGCCPTHIRIVPEQIRRLKAQHPNAEVIVHPECIPAVTALADVVASTSGMVRHARQTKAKTLIVGTEEGLLHRMRRENPQKVFVLASEAAVCPNMKLHTPEKILWSLEQMEHEVRVPEKVRRRALRAIERMLAIAKGEKTQLAAPSLD